MVLKGQGPGMDKNRKRKMSIGAIINDDMEYQKNKSGQGNARVKDRAMIKKEKGGWQGIIIEQRDWSKKRQMSSWLVDRKDLLEKARVR